MVNYYKRYIYKNGVKQGPYYYSNKKVNGKVISTYLGTKPPSKINIKYNPGSRKIIIAILSVISVALLIYIAYSFHLFSTGKQIANPDITGISRIVPSDNLPEIDLANATKIIQNPLQKASVNTIQGPAVINQPVKFTKEVSLANPGKTIVEVPTQAENIAIYKVKTDGTKEKISDSQIQITARASSEIILDNQGQSSIINFFKKIISFFTGRIVTIQDTRNVKEISIDENEQKYEIEYETPAPYVVEENTYKGKTLKIVSPGSINYQDVLVSTSLDEALNVQNQDKVKVYWVEQGTYIQPNSVEDKNSNGIYDYLEFTAPQSDNQTFEIIVITKAEHLDSNRAFVSDIYEQVKDLDDVWSEPINNNEYVRVTFEKNLTSENDITIYPRIVSGSPKIEVYEKDKNQLIAEFQNLTDNEYNQVLLKQLQENQDTFDLRVIGGSVEFDYIVDPFAQPGTIPDLRPQVCNGEDNSNTKSFFNGNCDSLYPGVCSAINDWISCNDGRYETHTSNRNTRYGGVKIQSYNSSVANCQNINQVFLCYEWWASTTLIADCDISVDANSGTSFTAVTTTCPGTAANPGVTCTNVTALESWTCGSFFGAAGARAMAKSEFRSSSGTTTRTMTWDVLFFNVTYTQSNSPPTIPYITPISDQSPTDNGVTNVVFEVSVSDSDGVADIDSTSVKANFTKAGEQTRLGSCSFVNNIDANTANYSCSVAMQYYDAPGTWSISVNATDLSNALALNNSQTFVYLELKSINISSPAGSLNWPTLNTGSENQSAINTPNVIQNTGNYQGPISITAKDLIGQTDASEIIPASSFKASIASGSECAIAATQLQNATAVQITGSNLPRGSGASANIFYCIPSVPLISSQSYSATGSGAWIIGI